MNLNRLVKEELSGSRAKSYVAQISRFHRIQGSPMFHESAEYVKNELQKLGLKDATIEQFPADGKTKYWTYTSPIGWEAKTAELRLIEPEPEKLLCMYKETPQSLHTFSKATRPEGVTAELVDVGEGLKPKDYEGKNVGGKFVLATGRARYVHAQAVYKYGAAGVITDTCSEFPKVRESIDVPDAHAYQGIWPTAEDLDKLTFGFSISKRQGNALRALLQAGKTVKLKAKVNAKLFPFHADVVTATIKGKTEPKEEIFLVAHLCHPRPSANDNASGAGLLLEVASTIKTLINSGKIPQPARTVRFIWVPETLGTVAYLAKHTDLPDRLIAGINLDMVGQDQEKCKSTLRLDRTPDSLPSFLNDYVYSLMEQTVREFDCPTVFGSGSTFRYGLSPFSGGSDHAEFANSSTKIPCVMLIQWPDLYYHTSMDTIDNVSEDSLKRVGWITTVATLTLANVTPQTALYLASQTATRGKARISEASREAIQEAIQEIHSNTSDKKLKPKDLTKQIAKTAAYYKDKIEHITWREQEAIKSIKRLASNPELDAHLNEYCKDITKEGEGEIARIEKALAFTAKASRLKLPKPEKTKTENELKKLVPRRVFKGSLSTDAFRKAVGEKGYEWYEQILERDLDFSKKMLEIINFIDGKRNALQIAQAVSAEYTPTDSEHVDKFLKDLQKTKLVTFKKL